MNDFDPEELERITARAEDMLARVEELRSEIDVVVGRGEAADGQVRVTAGASGRLMDVVLAPRAMRLDSQKLAEAVLRAAQEAQDDVAAKVDAVMTDALGGALPGGELLDEQFGSVLEAFESSMDEQLRAIDDRTRDGR
ncbi:YbaB/EbfC family nucleoid-associated protein [Nonomuraea angiospora]|uniref:DNA-binding protein YbaB n=1 Tax=Nonomuraea angiospora TaxID=46172 RepID=A0ABR9MFQ0_9ACTN|nr:YbaB/EbfC family nucleoid-associated protein [Nonomuraea angiospora]MBE1591722.1 DNA-binding protein YbaB [Nonomuraea angiospora]MDX3106762.1 YbaB/EbfC family nucleoid-associated protein [Nonomuraea angiospora]